LKGRSLPLGPLLVQDTVTALLAANVLTASEGHARRAVTADVDDRRAVDGHTAGALEGVLATHGGHLVSFTRHGGGFVVSWVGCFGESVFLDGRAARVGR
jgi:hypothetical protein